MRKHIASYVSAALLMGGLAVAVPLAVSAAAAQRDGTNAPAQAGFGQIKAKTMSATSITTRACAMSVGTHTNLPGLR